MKITLTLTDNPNGQSADLTMAFDPPLKRGESGKLGESAAYRAFVVMNRALLPNAKWKSTEYRDTSGKIHEVAAGMPHHD